MPSGEEHRPTGRGPGGRDGLELAQALPPLLTEALDDEERVVDAHGEPDHHDHVDDEERLREEEPHHGYHPHADEDGHQGKRQGDAGGHQRTEHEDENEQGDGESDHLGPGQVPLGGSGEFMPDAGPTHRRHRESLGVLGAYRCQIRFHGVAVVSGVAHERDRDEGGMTVGRDHRFCRYRIEEGSLVVRVRLRDGPALREQGGLDLLDPLLECGVVHGGRVGVHEHGLR